MNNKARCSDTGAAIGPDHPVCQVAAQNATLTNRVPCRSPHFS